MLYALFLLLPSLNDSVHWDYNPISVGDSLQRQLHWISNVDEHGPTLHYIER